MKDKFKKFLMISGLIHVLVLISFFRVVIYTPSENITQSSEQEFQEKEDIPEGADSLWWEDFLDTLAFADDSGQFEESKEYAGQDFTGKLFEEPLLENITPPHPIANPLENSIDNLNIPLDSLKQWALSELLRRELTEVLREELSRAEREASNPHIDWDLFLDQLSEDLAKFSPGGEAQPSSSNNFEKNLAQLFSTPRTNEIWKQTVLQTLMREAYLNLQSIINRSITDAARCLSTGGPICSDGNGNGSDFYASSNQDKENDWEGQSGESSQDGQEGNKSGTASHPGRGSAGSAASGNNSTNDNAPAFARLLEQELNFHGRGMGWALSLFPRESLLNTLSFQAEASAKNLAGSNDPLWGKIIRETDFRSAIERGLFLNHSEKEAAQAGQKLLNDIRFAFFSQLRQGYLVRSYNEAQQQNNRVYFNVLAEDYWQSLYYLGRGPGRTIYDPDKYRRFSDRIHNRIVTPPPVYTGKGKATAAGKQEYTHPETVLLLSRLVSNSRKKRETDLIPPQFPSHAYGAAPRVTQPIVVDGILSNREWEDARPYKLTGKAQGRENIPPYLTDCNYLLAKWDNRGFYFAYWIRDNKDNETTPEYFWAGDALELFFDPFNQKEPLRAEERNYQYWIWPRAVGKRGSVGRSVVSSFRNWYPVLLEPGAIQFASRHSGNGYTCEVFFPAAFLKDFYPLPGRIIGFNYSINNGKRIYLRWLTNMGDNISFRPNLGGDLLLMGEDAELETKRSYVLPGQTIELTIKDMDMNLAPDLQDKIEAKARSHLTGDQLSLRLVETGNNSGIFTCKIGTVFGLQAGAYHKLFVKPGDVVTLRYVDNHTSGGRRDLPVILKVPVGRAVFTLGSN